MWNLICQLHCRPMTEGSRFVAPTNTWGSTVAALSIVPRRNRFGRAADKCLGLQYRRTMRIVGFGLFPAGEDS